MSKQNKVNRDSYVQRGRLTPDDMARERMKQGESIRGSKGKENVIGRRRAAQESTRPRSAPEE